MALTTDGAPAPLTDWDSVLSDGIASTGVDPNGSFDEPAPQPDQSGSSEGAETSATPPAPAPAAAGDDGPVSAAQPGTARPAPPVADPSAPETIPDAKPFAFTVQGQERTIEGWHHLPGEGVFVPEAQVPHLQLLMSRAEFLDGQHKDLQRQVHQDGQFYTWTPPGAQAPLSGRAGAEALHASRAELMAENQAYKTLLSDPENLRLIATADENGNLHWIPQGTENFLLKMQQTVGQVRNAVRDHFAKLGQPVQTANGHTQGGPATFDAVRAAPAIVEHALANAPDSSTWKQHLTTEDREWAQQLAPRYVKSATAADVRENPALRVGEPVLEPEFIDQLRNRANLRAGTAKVVTTAVSAAKFNGGMNAGKAAPARPATKPSTTPASPPTRKPGKAEAWDNILKDAMQDIQL